MSFVSYTFEVLSRQNLYNESIVVMQSELALGSMQPTQPHWPLSRGGLRSLTFQGWGRRPPQPIRLDPNAIVAGDPNLSPSLLLLRNYNLCTT